jgi:phage-related protein
MRFTIVKLQKAIDDFENLSAEQQSAVNADYTTIQTRGIEFVKRRFLQDGIFEIKTDDVRSLFKYAENQIIIIGLVYTKKTQKTPKQVLKTAKKRLAEE